MPVAKVPFHKFASGQLLKATQVICRINSSNNRQRLAEEILYQLENLKGSIIPALDAHNLAVVHSNLPAILERVGLTDLARFAKETLADLAAREDEKKPEVSSISYDNEGEPAQSC